MSTSEEQSASPDECFSALDCDTAARRKMFKGITAGALLLGASQVALAGQSSPPNKGVQQMIVPTAKGMAIAEKVFRENLIREVATLPEGELDFDVLNKKLQQYTECLISALGAPDSFQTVGADIILSNKGRNLAAMSNRLLAAAEEILNRPPHHSSSSKPSGFASAAGGDNRPATMADVARMIAENNARQRRQDCEQAFWLGTYEITLGLFGGPPGVVAGFIAAVATTALACL